MKMSIFLQGLLGVCSITVTLHCDAVGRFATSAQKISCGDASYIIKSPCQRSDDGGLNECKRQTLQITNGGRNRKATLPDLTEADAKRYKDTGGDLNSLYVVQWGCVSHLNKKYLLLYYSIGGGSAPYSEFYTKYDAAGTLLSNRDASFPGEVYDYFNDHSTPVHSIMPRD